MTSIDFTIHWFLLGFLTPTHEAFCSVLQSSILHELTLTKVPTDSEPLSTTTASTAGFYITNHASRIQQ